MRTILILLIICLRNGFLKANDFELSDQVIPLEYDLIITPNLKDGTYTGTVHIIVNVTEVQTSIILHSKNLVIIEARINYLDVEVTTVSDYDFLKLLPYTPVLEGTNLIQISFNGDIKQKANGFYRAYEIIDEELVYFATTFFSPTNARAAFPCFDQPNFKARFSISIAKPNGYYVALSNMNEVAETRTTNEYTYIRFAKTPPIPVHLVSFFVGNYSYIEDFYVKQNTEIVPIRIYSSPININKYKFLIEEIPSILSWYADYTGVDYMLPKLDYIVYFPKYDVYGKMENWGSLASTKNAIFYNDMMSTLCRNYTINMFHHLGHIWFEQLLTASSWGEFWLTEGFVRFMDRKAISEYAECDEALLVQTTILHNALWGDDDISTKPLSQEIETSEDIYNMFNYITYEKGCSILVMLEELIGEELMQQVMQTYIKEYQYQTVNSQDFIDVFQNFIDFDVGDFLSGFVKQEGYPLITVDLSENRSQVILTQERFLRMGQEDTEHNETRWTLPIKYISDINDEMEVIWFNSSEDEVVINFPANINWIKLNYERSGYYRTNYPKYMWRYFSRIVKYFDVKDRIHLIDDSMALVRSGHLHCSIAFNIMNYMYDEDRYEVWKVAQNNFNTIFLGLQQHELDPSYLKAYVTELIDKQYYENSWIVHPEETVRSRNTRKTIFTIACFYGHEDCVRKADELQNMEELIPEDIVDILNASGIKESDDQELLEMEWEMLSFWFGADLSMLSKENRFHWPKHAIENCNRWLKDQYEE